MSNVTLGNPPLLVLEISFIPFILIMQTLDRHLLPCRDCQKPTQTLVWKLVTVQQLAPPRHSFYLPLHIRHVVFLGFAVFCFSLGLPSPCLVVKEILLSPKEQCLLASPLYCLPSCFMNFLQQMSSIHKWNCGIQNFPHLIIHKQTKLSIRDLSISILFWLLFVPLTI